MPPTSTSSGILPKRRWPISSAPAAAIEPSRAPAAVEASRAAPPTRAIGAELALETTATYAAPPLDDDSAIDELAFVLATEHLSTLEKIALLEQWRYDMLLRDMASAEGLCAGRESGAFLQQINKALLYLGDGRCWH